MRAETADCDLRIPKCGVGGRVGVGHFLFGHLVHAGTTSMAAPSKHNTSRPALAADSLATGILFMMVLTVVQRMIGFVRTILFCRFLDDDQLGQWSLMFGFMMFAAPVAMFGLTGSFGRYLEHFRARGHLTAFIRRTSLVAATLGLGAVSLIGLGRHWFSWFIFKDAEQGQLVLAVAGALLVMIVFNFLTEIFMGLRRSRVVSLMELVSSLIFATLGLGLLLGTDLGAVAVVLAYACGNFVASLVGIFELKRNWQLLPQAQAVLPHRELWAKLAPFAIWVWLINIVANSFEMADRYMIIHFSGFEAAAAQALVGQYYSSLAVPALLVAVASVFSNVLLPHLSHDWEAGRKDSVSRQVSMALKVFALLALTGGVLILVASPVIFGWALAGKYDGGLRVLPWSITFCIWSSLTLIAQTYLWCAERTRISCLSFTTGLLVNLLLNWLLLPRFGLLGAVLATSIAQGLALALTCTFCRRCGMRLDGRLVVVCTLPVLLGVGPLPAAIGLVLIVTAARFTNAVFTAEEKQHIESILEEHVTRIRRRVAKAATNVT